MEPPGQLEYSMLLHYLAGPERMASHSRPMVFTSFDANLDGSTATRDRDVNAARNTEDDDPDS
jgi:hypothetical protein